MAVKTARGTMAAPAGKEAMAAPAAGARDNGCGAPWEGSGGRRLGRRRWRRPLQAQGTTAAARHGRAAAAAGWEGGGGGARRGLKEQRLRRAMGGQRRPQAGKEAWRLALRVHVQWQPHEDGGGALEEQQRCVLPGWKRAAGCEGGGGRRLERRQRAQRGRRQGIG
ncbi:hypothetical protein BRADI_2g32885v3 [Brachypodium distachyon]|uniref:Uncharacterized protein n=1 Tax=Brachypodium distachyon TaxID=15368 RepID=A0A0Q3G6U0_BRADI|nr:hypothetical protein BRADI_2g32885v3 [Brachypodium distachyon]